MENINNNEQLNYKEFLYLPTFESYEEKLAYLDDLRTGKRKFPIIQGGKGLQISNVESATAVTKAGGIGTLSGSVPGVDESFTEVEERIDSLKKNYSFSERKELSRKNNKLRFQQDIDQYAENTGHQIRAANIMKAVPDFEDMVKIAGESGKIDMLFVGAGIYTKCAKHAKEYPNMMVIPIVSSAKLASWYVSLTKNQQEELGAIYFEHPFAGGHDGYDKRDNFADKEVVKEKYDPQKIYDEISQKIPNRPLLVGGGGIATHEDVQKMYEIGYSGVVSGTMFSLAKESGFSTEIKKEVILNEKLPTIQSKTSPAKMVSTSVDNRFIARMEELKKIKVKDESGQEITAYEAYYKERVLKCINCIGEKCPFKAKDPEALYCIAHELRRAMLGEIDALIFTGMVRDKAMKLSIFKEDNGEKRIPSTAEIYDMMAGKIAA